MEEPLTNNDDILDKNYKDKNCNLKIIVIIFIILGIIIIGLIIGIIFVATSKKEKIVEKIIPAPEIEDTEMNWNYFGEFMINKTYSNNGIIENTFKLGGKNYDQEIGVINNGQDYPENERNNYNLYIPHSAMLNKENYNGVILFVHGGSWIGGEKESFENFCKIYGEMGFITATMGYTVLFGIYPNNNIFRIMDEISLCIDDIKGVLKEKGFDDTKLELAIGGYSAGGHLILLYSYLIESSSIPLKFAIDICGPISVEPKHYYRLVKVNDTLESLELSYIEEAMKNKRLVRTSTVDTFLLQYMNAFLGERYNNSDLEEMLNANKTINYSNEKFQKLYNSVKHSFPVSIQDKNKIPTLCLYTGNDDVVGVVAFAYLKEKAKEDNKTMELIYSKYADHGYLNFTMQNSIDSLRDLNVKIQEYAKLYFTN